MNTKKLKKIIKKLNKIIKNISAQEIIQRLKDDNLSKDK